MGIRDLETMLKHFFFLAVISSQETQIFFFLMPFMTSWKHEFEMGVWNSIKSHPLMSCWEHMDVIFTYRVFPLGQFSGNHKGLKAWLTVTWSVMLDNKIFNLKVRVALNSLPQEGWYGPLSHLDFMASRMQNQNRSQGSQEQLGDTPFLQNASKPGAH